VCWLLVMIGFASHVQAQTVAFFETGEEFVGPFPSWRHVKADYGAKGDGVTDDTAAIQAAIDDLRNMPGNRWSTLYFPTATYRIGKTLINQRQCDIPHVISQTIGATPDEQAVLETLSQVRALRIEPPVKRPEGVAHVKLIRVQVRASQGRMGLILKR
jgi:hypothetical protein